MKKFLQRVKIQFHRIQRTLLFYQKKSPGQWNKHTCTCRLYQFEAQCERCNRLITWVLRGWGECRIRTVVGDGGREIRNSKSKRQDMIAKKWLYSEICTKFTCTRIWKNTLRKQIYKTKGNSWDTQMIKKVRNLSFKSLKNRLQNRSSGWKTGGSKIRIN